jgi:hypothetical protein
MLSNVKDYASSLKTTIGETYTSYLSKDKMDALLIEITSDAYECSNQKMLDLADATHGQDCQKIIDHLLLKLQSPAFEWKRIIKTL